MPKTLDDRLKDHLAQEVTTLCTMWEMQRRTDDMRFYFTDHDQDIVYNGHRYLAALGYTRTALQADSGMSVDNMNLSGLFDSDTLTVEDLRAGLLDYAEVKIFIINWADLSMGEMKVRRGTLGEVLAMTSGLFQTEFRGMMQTLALNVGEVTSPTCRADLGDARCKIDLVGSGWQVVATVTSVTDAQHFSIAVVEPRAVDGWFTDGVVTFTNWQNLGRSMEIKAWTQSTAAVRLFLPMPMPVTVGDTLTLYPGCDKRLETCRDKFANVINRRAEDFVPGADVLTKNAALT